MLNKNLIIISLLGCMLGTSCVSQKHKEDLAKAPTATPTFESRLKRADLLAQQKSWQQAFTQYSELLEECDELKQTQEILLKISNALFHMTQYSSALSSLAPLPEIPTTLYDCQRLAMASRILNAMNSKPEHVEALLEIAVDNTIQEPGILPFKAKGYAELGQLYLKNQKISRAKKCFEYAAGLYEKNGEKDQAKVCRNIMEYLR